MVKRASYSLREITGRYLGMPFSEMPCLELVYRIYTDIGVDFPDHYIDVTREDFLARWRKKRKGMESLMMRFFREIGNPGNVSNPKRFDLLACFGQTRAVFPAVYTGRGHAITSTIKEGVCVVPVKHMNRVLVVRRVVNG